MDLTRYTVTYHVIGSRQYVTSLQLDADQSTAVTALKVYTMQHPEVTDHAQSHRFTHPQGNLDLVDSLPFELLSRIFKIGVAVERVEETLSLLLSRDMYQNEDVEEASDQDFTTDEQESNSCRRPLLLMTLTHLCRRWRDIAISTSSLWTCIRVSHATRAPYNFVSLQLERSRDLPIEIHIDWDRASNDENSAESLYTLLVAHAHRWQAVNVETFQYRDMHEFIIALSQPSVTAPQLTRLRLRHSEFGAVDLSTNREHILFGGFLPSLRSLTLSGVAVNWDQTWITAASRLKNLSLIFHPQSARPSWAQFSAILRGAPILESLNLYWSGPSGSPADWVIQSATGSTVIDLNPPIQLLKLTHIILRSIPPVHVIGLLQRFYMPGLTSLTFHLPHSECTQLVRELTGLAISPSFGERPCSLLNRIEELHLSRFFCLPEAVEYLCDELHNVKSLTIPRPIGEFITTILELLLPYTLPGREDATVRMPRLEYLSVSSATGVISLLRKVVQTRKDVGVPIKSLSVPRWDKLNAMSGEDEVWFRDNSVTVSVLEDL